MIYAPAFSAAVFLVISIAVIATAMAKQPGIGIIIGLLTAGVLAWLRRPEGLPAMGLTPPQSWPATILASLVIGAVIVLLSLILLDPGIEQITGEPHDLSVVDQVRGNLPALLQWIAIVWIFVALIEEIVFRGFLFAEAMNVVGSSPLALAGIVIVTSVVFGLAHAYQGKSGIISTSIIGAMLAGVYIWGEYNLWMVILAHGVIDTLALTLMYAGVDHKLRHLIFPEVEQADSTATI